MGELTVGKDLTWELSASQGFILIGQQLQANDPLYNMALAYRLQGAIDQVTFGRAFQALVDHCDALRTVLVEESGVWRQRVLAQLVYNPEFVDIAEQEDTEYQAEQLLEKWSRDQFDLKKCLFASKLVRLSRTQYIWFFNQHHVITDAWSFRVIFSHLGVLYKAAREGSLQLVPPLPPFGDYLKHERLLRDSRQFERARSYWKERLQTSQTPSRFYRRSPSDRSGKTVRLPLVLNKNDTERLYSCCDEAPFRAFTRDLSVMQLFATVLFAYLYRITGNGVLTIGTPSHLRSSTNLEETVGLLINIFPLRIQIDRADTFASLYRKIAGANHELLVNALPGSVDAAHNRLFDVVLNYIPSSFGSFDSMPVESSWIHPGYGDRNHLLRLQIHNFDQTDNLHLFFDLNEDVFVGQERDWVVSHFQVLLQALMSEPETAICAPPLLSADTVAGYEIGTNLWPASRSVEDSIVMGFCRQAGQHPDRIALRCIDENLSYASLEQRSAALAALIVGENVTAGTVVALCVHRSIETVAAVLGILRSGAVLLPIDPANPDERIAYILRDSGAALFLAGAAHASVARETRCRYIDLEVMWRESFDTSPLPESTLKAGNTAYLIYTSGSTGRPKGVQVIHGSLSNYVKWAAEYYLDGETLDFALFSSLGFDLTLTSMFVPLVAGSTLHIYPESDNPADITIRQVVEDNRAQVIKLTPAHLSVIQSMDFSRSVIRKLIVGGEDFKCELAATLSRYFGGDIEIFNEYGPTETTVACTVHRYDSSDVERGSVPIGRPITNARIYLLDEYLNSVPQGVIGEIYIGGAVVAQGYLGRDELTAERFLADIAPDHSLVYRSGDLGICNEQGQIEYRGRIDNQVKVRGVRIETQEIEASLLEHDAVADVAVTLVASGSKRQGKDVVAHCNCCGLASNHPGAQLDESGICRLCRIFDSQQQYAKSYFRTLDDLKSLIKKIRGAASGPQDSLMMLSGGKDSSYALCRLVEMGLTPLVFTLDNGYISKDAQGNIRRLVDSLGLELIVGKTPAMNQIFADSLTRHSNVCNGCFKTIYTLSMKIARERGIGTICTGLSRGQIFETRVAHLFQQGVFDPPEIDRQIIEARKAYHRTDDIISRSLDVEVFREDSIFKEISFLDFYRYTDVTLDEVYSYLSVKAPWIRPGDTGRSTNCLINEVGIAVHMAERGYHNYALPYSWDVRLGHKQRDAALAELEDEIDDAKVSRILSEIGYRTRPHSPAQGADSYLAAYYVAAQRLSEQQLREHLLTRLPPEFIPRRFIEMTALPLSANGKVDRALLPVPDLARPELVSDYVAPRDETETILSGIWSRMLSINDVGVNDNFFELGGDSIVSIQIVSAAREAGITIKPQQIFEYPTIRALAGVAGTVVQTQAEQGTLSGEVPLLPSQLDFLQHGGNRSANYCQRVLLVCRETLDAALLKSALEAVLCHHDGLRASFERQDNIWRQRLLKPGEVSASLCEFVTDDSSPDSLEKCLDILTPDLLSELDLAAGRLVAAALISNRDGYSYLLMVAHHLVVDGVSWWILLGDLESACRQLRDSGYVRLGPKTTSVRQWANALIAWAGNVSAAKELAYWRKAAGTFLSLSGPRSITVGSKRLDRKLMLDAEITGRIVRDVPASYGVQVAELLLTALLRALSRLRGERCFRVAMEGHGRESLVKGYDLDRTVGWFTSIYPVSISMPESGNLSADLKRVKQALRDVPERGAGFGPLRYLAPSKQVRDEMETFAPADLLFNYMGLLERSFEENALFRFKQPLDIVGDEVHFRRHPLEVNIQVFDQCLRIGMSTELSQSGDGFDGLESLLHESVVELVDYCLNSSDYSLTPSDFPAADLDQGELDDILAEFGGLEGGE